MRATRVIDVLAGAALCACVEAQPCAPTWQSLGDGIDGQVRGMGVYDPDGPGPAGNILYVGGFLDFAGGTPVSNIAQWNGSLWVDVGGGVDPAGLVFSFAVFDEDGPGPNPPVLLVGGEFVTAGIQVVNNIARWDGSNWSALGSGTAGAPDLADVYAIAVFDEDGDGPNLPVLIVGGEFDSAGGVSASKIARWDGAAWSAVSTGAGAEFDFVSALLVHDEDGPGPIPPALFVGGDFDIMGGVTAHHIARWNGSVFSALGSGTSGFVDDLAAFDEDGNGPEPARLFAVGAFNRAGDQTVAGLGRWHGTAWSSVNGGFNNVAFALAVFDEDGTGPGPEALYAAGTFTLAGGVPANFIARWNGTTWSALGSGLSARVLELVTYDSDGSGPAPEALIAGGIFTTAGGIPANRVAAWVGCGPPTCMADVNNDGVLNSQDVFDFLACFFDPPTCPPGAADYNSDGTTNSQDFFDFLADFFEGCP